MKLAVMAAFAALVLSSSATVDVDEILKKSRSLGLSAQLESDLYHATEEYEKAVCERKEAFLSAKLAESNLVSMCETLGLVEGTKLKAKGKDKKEDPDLRKLRDIVSKQKGRFEILKKTLYKWGPSTNLTARAARQSMQERLNETRAERDAAKEYEKRMKEIRKNAEKDAKNAGKLRKDIEKYRDKAETEAFRSLCSGLLEAIGNQ